jgi:hypothetical protein
MVDKMEKVLEEAEEERLKMVEKIAQEKDEWEELIKENEDVERLNAAGKERIIELRAEGKRIEQEHKEMAGKLAQLKETIQEKEKTTALVEAQI